MMFEAVLEDVFVTFQWIDRFQGKSWLSSTSPQPPTSPPGANVTTNMICTNFFKITLGSRLLPKFHSKMMLSGWRWPLSVQLRHYGDNFVGVGVGFTISHTAVTCWACSPSPVLQSNSRVQQKLGVVALPYTSMFTLSNTAVTCWVCFPSNSTYE